MFAFVFACKNKFFFFVNIFNSASQLTFLIHVQMEFKFWLSAKTLKRPN